MKEIEGRLEELTEKEQDAIVRTAEQELLAIHPDFTELRATEPTTLVALLPVSYTHLTLPTKRIV